jgi:hypothetical protein
MSKIKLSLEAVQQAMTGIGHPGVCLSCGDFDEYAGCEPDAMNYECGVCGEKELFGLEMAIVMDKIELTD